MNCHANHPQEMYSSSSYLGHLLGPAGASEPLPGSLLSELLLTALFHFSPHPHLPALVSCQPSASCPITRHVLVTIHVVPYPFSFPWLSIRRASWGLGWEEDSWTGFLLPSSFWRASLDRQLADTQGMEAGHGVGAGGKPE